jgi:hypothetical protein
VPKEPLIKPRGRRPDAIAAVMRGAYEVQLANDFTLALHALGPDDASQDPSHSGGTSALTLNDLRPHRRHVLPEIHSSASFAFAAGFCEAEKDGASVRCRLRPELSHQAESDNR